jgi:hypothetical protein
MFRLLHMTGVFCEIYIYIYAVNVMEYISHPWRGRPQPKQVGKTGLYYHHYYQHHII